MTCNLLYSKYIYKLHADLFGGKYSVLWGTPGISTAFIYTVAQQRF